MGKQQIILTCNPVGSNHVWSDYCKHVLGKWPEEDSLIKRRWIEEAIQKPKEKDMSKISLTVEEIENGYSIYRDNSDNREWGATDSNLSDVITGVIATYRLEREQREAAIKEDQAKRNAVNKTLKEFE